MTGKLAKLNERLDVYLGRLYGKEPKKEGEYKTWHDAHKPFHWFAEFYEIIHDRGGFDVIIGNPPYVEYLKVQKTYKLPQNTFVTEDCGNLLAYVSERSLTLSADKGRSGLVLLVSTFTTERMKKLQQLILSTCSDTWTSNFAWRPAKLFAGCNTINTILLCEKSINKERSNTYSTKYIKWSTEERDTLFESISYGMTDKYRITGSFPKVTSDLDASILDKILSQTKSLSSAFNGTNESNKLYYFRGMLYWIKILDHLPIHKENGVDKISSQCKLVLIDSKIPAHSVISILSSSLFFWYFQTYSDCQQINQREFAGFKFQTAIDTLAELKSHGINLMQDYNRNSKVIDRRIQSRDASVQKEYFEINKSKPIIDLIDTSLAKHYGFTDEVLDFIINYDIKYRMGRGGGDDEDAE